MSDNNGSNSERRENWADRNEKPVQWASRSNDSERMEARRRKLSPQVINVIGAHIIAAFLWFVGCNLLSLALSDIVAIIIGYIASTFAFIAVLYVEGWRAGEQDVNMMNYGHIKKDKLRGLKAACLGEILGVLLAILAIAHEYVVLAKLGEGLDYEIAKHGISQALLAMYRLFYAPFQWLIGGISVGSDHTMVTVFTGIDTISPLLCLLPIVVAPIVYHVAYTLGMKGFSISAKLIYKKPNDENK